VCFFMCHWQTIHLLCVCAIVFVGVYVYVRVGGCRCMCGRVGAGKEGGGVGPRMKKQTCHQVLIGIWIIKPFSHRRRYRYLSHT